MKGWIKIYRSLTGHWLWDDPVKAHRWMDLLLMVNHKETKVNIKGSLYLCRRGQTLRSLDSWGKRWGVSKDVVRGFLNLLQKDEMIKVENILVSTRITICNYDEYQGILDGDSPQLLTNKNDNNGKNEKNDKKKNKKVWDQKSMNIPRGLNYNQNGTF